MQGSVRVRGVRGAPCAVRRKTITLTSTVAVVGQRAGRLLSQIARASLLQASHPGNRARRRYVLDIPFPRPIRERYVDVFEIGAELAERSLPRYSLRRIRRLCEVGRTQPMSWVASLYRFHAGRRSQGYGLAARHEGIDSCSCPHRTGSQVVMRNPTSAWSIVFRRTAHGSLRTPYGARRTAHGARF